MEILESFEFKNKIYEIRMIVTNHRVTVRAYHQDKEANRFSYSIDKETSKDFIQTHGRDALKELIQQAKSDIIGI